MDNPHFFEIRSLFQDINNYILGVQGHKSLNEISLGMKDLENIVNNLHKT